MPDLSTVMAKTSGRSAVQRSFDVPFGSMRKTRPRWPVAAYRAPSGPVATLQMTGCSEVKSVSSFGARDRRPSRPRETPSNLPLTKSEKLVISQVAEVEAREVDDS